MKPKQNLVWKLLAVAFLTLASTLAYGAYEQGRAVRSAEFSADLREFCAATDGELPSITPQRLVMEVTDEWNRTLTGDVQSRVRSSLLLALSVYNFSNRILIGFGPDSPNPMEGDHRMGLVVVLGRWLELMNSAGRQCSNRVLVSYTTDSTLLELRFVHELGHYFGLYHEFGTYLGHPACPVTHERKFNERQAVILDRWNHPGTPYVRHWIQMERDGKQDPAIPCAALPIPMIAGVLISFLFVGTAVGVVLVNRRKKPAP